MILLFMGQAAARRARLERTTAGAALEGIFGGRVGWGEVGVGGV
jgi:hypothetical protein